MPYEFRYEPGVFAYSNELPGCAVENMVVIKGCRFMGRRRVAGWTRPQAFAEFLWGLTRQSAPRKTKDADSTGPEVGGQSLTGWEQAVVDCPWLLDDQYFVGGLWKAEAEKWQRARGKRQPELFEEEEMEEEEEKAGEEEEFLDTIYTPSLLADKKYHRERQRTDTFEPAFEVGPHPGPKGARDKTVTMVSPMCQDARNMAKRAGVWASFQVPHSACPTPDYACVTRHAARVTAVGRLFYVTLTSSSNTR